MRIVVHIGRPKTGSTAIQSWLRANHDVLREQRYALSDVCGAPNNSNLAAQFGSAPITWCHRHSVKGPRAARAYLTGQRFLERFGDEIRERLEWAETLVLTSEQLSRLVDPGELRAFLTEFSPDVQVVGYVRSQSEALASAWYTSVRGGGQDSLDRFVQRRMASDAFDYDRWASSWASAFGEGHCHFRQYHGTRDWDVRRDFAERVLHMADAATLRFPAKRENRKWSRSQTDAVRMINRLFPYLDPRSNGLGRVNMALRGRALRALRGRGAPIELSPAQHRAVVARFEESNRIFSHRFLDGVPFGPAAS